MTADQFRKLALRLPEALEGEHMGHPDFRVGGKIFATLGPRGDWGMVKLTPEQQAVFVGAAGGLSANQGELGTPGVHAGLSGCGHGRHGPPRLGRGVAQHGAEATGSGV